MRPGSGRLNLYRSMLAVFTAFVASLFAWLFLTAIWNRMGPDYEASAFIAVWRIPQIVQHSIAAFLGGYAASWVAGHAKVLHAGLAVVPFGLMLSGMETETAYPLSVWATLLVDPGIPVVCSIMGGWYEWKHPLQP